MKKLNSSGAGNWGGSQYNWHEQQTKAILLDVTETTGWGICNTEFKYNWSYLHGRKASLEMEK